MNEDNSLRDLHDSALVCSRLFRGGDALYFEFVSEVGRVISLTANKVSAFRLVDMSLQNIVSRAIIVKSRSSDETLVKTKLAWVTSSVDSPSYLTSNAIDNYFVKIKSGELCLLIIEPSVGAEIVVLCNKIVIGHPYIPSDSV